jgi:hypothetical protein
MNRESQEEVVYAALSSQRLVGLGGDLDSLLTRICRDFEMSGEDVAVWQERESGPARLVAVVRAELMGHPTITRFCHQQEIERDRRSRC